MHTPDISVAELRRALARLLDATEERFGADLRFSEDFYWNVSFSEATVLDREPRLDMGSVVDDVASVREYVTSDRDEYESIWHEADHIVGLLRAIARLDSPR